MPNANAYPRGAVTTRVDVRQWQGARLFSFGSTHVDAPNDWGPFFDDAVVLLTGRGTALAANRCSMAHALAAALPAASSVSVSLSSITDRITLRAVGLAGHFTLAAGAANAVLGFDPAGQTSALLAGGETITAVGDWQRGVIESVAPTITSSVADGSTSGPLVTPSQYRVHCALDLLRTLGNGDADDSAGGMSLGTLSPGVRWGLTADGHVFMARNTSVTASALTWVSTTFRDFLGFTGLEAATTPSGSANLRVLTATYPCHGVLTPYWPLERVADSLEHVGQAQLLTSGRQYWVGQQALRRYDVTFLVDGYQARLDRARHFVDHVAPYLHPGAWVNVYQDWGDPRRARRTVDIRPGSAAYDTVATSQRDGDFGRLRCYLDRGAESRVALEFEGALRQRARVTLSLAQRPDSDA